MNKLYKIEIDGRERLVAAQIVDKKLWFKIDSETFSFDLLDLNETGFKKSKSKAKSSDKILAPMPGKITKIFISEGQKVFRGEALLVMEAMKMEYTLKTDIDAKVKSMNAKLGDQVVLGQLLVHLEENK